MGHWALQRPRQRAAAAGKKAARWEGVGRGIYTGSCIHTWIHTYRHTYMHIYIYGVLEVWTSMAVDMLYTVCHGCGHAPCTGIQCVWIVCDYIAITF